MEIKRDDPARRKSFRARHQCDTNPGPRWKAKYWSCKFWQSKKSVSDYLSNGCINDIIHQWDGETLWDQEDLLKLMPSLAQVPEITEEIEENNSELIEESYEMALGQLAYISDYSKDLLEKLRANPSYASKLEPWVQSKITLMEDYLFAVHNYIIYSQEGGPHENKNMQEGMRVLNTNASCKHFGSEGIIKQIKNLDNDMGQVIAYEVTNNGSNFKEGDILTKTIDQLNLLEGTK
jgi:hypothetical protein